MTRIGTVVRPPHMYEQQGDEYDDDKRSPAAAMAPAMKRPGGKHDRSGLFARRGSALVLRTTDGAGAGSLGGFNGHCPVSAVGVCALFFDQTEKGV